MTTLVPAWPAGLDTPAEPPVIGTDPRRLLEAAESLVTAAGRLREGAAAGACRWAGLPAVYAAAGTEPLYDLLRPVADDGDGLARALESAGDALTEHAQRLERLAVDRADLVDRLRSWRSWAAATEVGAGESWFVAVASHDLRAEVSAFAARVAAAEQACADTLAAIRGGTATGRRRAGRGDVLPAGLAVLDRASGASTRDRLDALAAMTPEAALAWLLAHPGFGREVAAEPPSVAETTAWWSRVAGRADAPALLDALVAGMPDGLGGLDGVPYRVRDAANRLRLATATDEALAAVHAAPPGTTPNLRSGAEMAAWRRWSALTAVSRALDGPGTRQLVELDLDAQPPLGAVAVGDLDGADHVGVLVPGMGTTLASGIEGLTGHAESLRAAQQDALGRTGRAAVVAWVGYEAPTVLTVLGSEHAEAGAPRLQRTLAGIDGTLGDTHLSVVMHSYGTTTGALALAGADLGVDDAVMLSSPGLTVDRAADLHAGDVWYAMPPDDRLAPLGNLSWEHPHSPLSPGFGGHWFEVPDVDAPLFGPHGLEHYLVDADGDPYRAGGEPGAALQQLVDITLGRDADVELENRWDYLGKVWREAWEGWLW